MQEEEKNFKTDSIKEQEIELVKEIPQNILDILQKVPKDRAGLIVIKGPSIGEKFLLKKPSLFIGRRSDSDILLDDITVSRNHAVIEKTNEGYIIKDLESLNGTYLNGEIVNKSRLNNGDRIQIGKYIFLFFS
ncbi:MAG: FHA domain-containing protein [Actinobacteria bacterium]|nr:FHA domain-containing protein [Actinomycetota bacterium]MBM3713106.1 FHA domain-containing protein [Actinomycetota bacterium]